MSGCKKKGGVFQPPKKLSTRRTSNAPRIDPAEAMTAATRYHEVFRGRVVGLFNRHRDTLLIDQTLSVRDIGFDIPGIKVFNVVIENNPSWEDAQVFQDVRVVGELTGLF